MSDYVSVEVLRDQIGKEAANQDENLGLLITAASRAIDRVCNVPDDYFLAPATGTTKIYTGSGSPVQWIDEAVAISLVEVKDSPSDTTYTAWAATDWIAGRGDPRDPDFNTLPYMWVMVTPTGDQSHFTSGRYSSLRGFRPLVDVDRPVRGVPTVRVTARWGYAAAVPPQIAECAIIQAARWFKRGQSAWSDAMGSADLGLILYRKVLDPDIQLILVKGRFIRPAIGRR